FFSSRRRHTRFDCDWSSDVCSSDLAPPVRLQPREEQEELQANEDDRVNTRPAALSVLVRDPVAHKAEGELGVELAVEVVGGEPRSEERRVGKEGGWRGAAWE